MSEQSFGNRAGDAAANKMMPTIGRIVHIHSRPPLDFKATGDKELDEKNQSAALEAQRAATEKPLAAIVVDVLDSGNINVQAFQRAGGAFFHDNLTDNTDADMFWAWPPRG